jgi:hypothetical protein
VSKLINIGEAIVSPHMGEVVGYRYLFITPLRYAHSRRGGSVPIYYISIHAVWLKDVPFGNFIIMTRKGD